MNIVNPAYAGSKGTLSIGILGRKQWINIAGAPQTMTLNIHAPIGKQLGAGLAIVSDKIGPITETNIFADISYTLDISKKSKLALGIKVGTSFFNGNLATLVTPSGTVGVDALLRDDVNKIFPNIGIGAYYYTDKFYAGISVPNMLSSEHFDNHSIAKASEKMHSFITTGYVFELSKHIDFKPSLIIKTAPKSPMSIDLSANVLVDKKFEAGLSYRFEDSVDILLGFQYSRDLRIGYSYDYTLSKLKDFNNGSHEMFIQFDLNYSDKNVVSPRFF
jgi:type IX secretion system PorP/SprF family membrane protein